MNLCCANWQTDKTTCLLQSTPCAPPTVAIQYQTLDAGTPQCNPGDTPCDVNTVASCCAWDCSATAMCTIASMPTCCSGYCGEVYCGGTTTHYDPACHDPQPNGFCDSANTRFSACCTDTGIVISAGALQRPTELGMMEAPEWTVSFGYEIPDSGSPAAVVVATSPADAAVAPACVPTTCEAERQTCATVDDGCGGKLVCVSDCSKLEQGGGCAVGAGSHVDAALYGVCLVLAALALVRRTR